MKSQNNKRKPFGWLDKVNTLSINKEKRIQDLDKAKAKYEKDLAKWKKEQEKQKLENAGAADKMRMNWQNYKENAAKAFSGSYAKSLSQPGQQLPKVPEKPTFDLSADNSTPKLASIISNLGSSYIEGMIKHASQMRRLSNLIKYIEYANNK